MRSIDTEQADSEQALAAPAGRTSRRKVLLGAGAIGAATAAAALTACAPGGSGAVDANSNDAADGANLAKSSDIPVGGGKIFADQQVVVVQPTAGDFKAFSAICTHEGCTVSSISGGLILCPCHGSEYSIVDGSVKLGPAPAPLPAKRVTVTNGEISVS